MDARRETTRKGEMHVSRPAADTLLVQLSGSWTLQSEVPTVAELQRQLEAGTGVQRLVVDTRELTSWDSGLVTFLRTLADLCAQRQITFNRDGLPDGGKGHTDDVPRGAYHGQGSHHGLWQLCDPARPHLHGPAR